MTGPAGTDATVFACITGGGTGGHVYPALAIADALVAAGHPRAAVHFIGAERGLEAEVVPPAGYSIDLLPGRGLQRRRSAIVANVRAAFDTLRGCVRAWGILGRLRPRVVVGVGGYASVPTVLAARLRRIPVVVHEQNAAPGLANRLAVRLGAWAAVSLPDTPLTRATLTGNPLRRSILETAWAPVEHPDQVAVVGGSLGAPRINEAALALAASWRPARPVTIRHVAGPRNYAQCAAAAARIPPSPGTLHYEVVAYEHDIAALYGRSRLVVARAGAVTIAELCAVGVPAVLVPLPGAPGDHQTKNAEALVAAGAAVLVPDAECDGPRLVRELDELLDAPERLDEMHRCARGLARPDAAGSVVALIERIAS